jgi:uncharacterized protein (TIGR02145 family)
MRIPTKHISKIKIIIFIFLLFKIQSISAQSKKEQIRTLNAKIDSLNNLLDNERVTNITKQQELNSLIKFKNLKIDSLYIQIKESLNKVNANSIEIGDLMIKIRNQSDSLNVINSELIKTKELIMTNGNLININSRQYESVNTEAVKEKISKSVKPLPTIKIGQQEWMTYDLNTILYNNGEPISEAITAEKWEEYGLKQIGCYRKQSNGTYVYNGFAVNDVRGIIPPGFTLPSYAQFNQLIKFLGGGHYAYGNATKSLATYPIKFGDIETIKIIPNGNSKFNAKKGGYVYGHGTLDNEDLACNYWWTSSSEETNIIVVDIGYCSQDLGGGKGSYPKTFGFAVRALKK